MRITDFVFDQSADLFTFWRYANQNAKIFISPIKSCFFCEIYGNKKMTLGEGGGLVLKYCRHVLPKSYLNPKFSKDLPLGFTLHRLVMKSLILGNIDALTCIIFQ
jgi:hypothetical protein